jgi:hypothetical protein
MIHSATPVNRRFNRVSVHRGALIKLLGATRPAPEVLVIVIGTSRRFSPSPLGTYLTALVIYEGITGLDVPLLPREAIVGGRPLDLSAGTVALLQQVAHETVVRLR